MNLKNLKTLAKEAAQSDFLWELGMRAPSSHQARKICQMLAIGLADEKRVKAVMRLREVDGNILEEIRCDSNNREANEMVEVMHGLKHYEIEAIHKDKELWRKIAGNLKIAIISHTGESKFFMRLWEPYDRRDDPSRFVTILRSGGGTSSYVIRIWPSHYAITPSQIQSNQRIASSFYCDHRVDFSPLRPDLGSTEKEWRMAIISVEDKSFLKLGKHIAHAYEAETARRRKAAKAIVLKNY